MKKLAGILSLTGLLILGFSCNRNDMQNEDVRDAQDIQREDSLGTDDIRETDTYDRSVPVQEETEIDRGLLDEEVDTTTR